MHLSSLDLLALAVLFAALASGVCLLAGPFPPVLTLAMFGCFMSGMFAGWALIRWSWGD